MTLRHQSPGEVNVDDPANIERFLAIINGTLNNETPQATVYAPSAISTEAAAALAYHTARPRPVAKLAQSTPDCNEEHPSREDLSRCTPLQKALIARRNEMGLYTTTDYMDNVVAGFRKDHEDANTEENEDMTAVGTPMTNDRASQSTGPEASALSDESALTNTLGGVQVFDESSSIQAEEDDTIIDDVDDAVSASDSTVLSSAASDRNESQQDDHIADLNAASGGPRDALSSAVTVATGTDLEENELDNMSDVDREQLPNLNGGGTPTAGGNKQIAALRTVVLGGLPRNADFTLVQSLIHGGTIETMRMSPAKPENGTTNAYITFITPEAFKQYYAKYPNGFELRQQGRKYDVFVDKQDRTEAISRIMQGYLECGATRVLKVSGAGDGWGIVALHKLATGQPSTCSVEAITDTYRNSVRTIFFRFTSITHAVKFKATLARDDDWESCTVEFAEDPCEKATGLRYDQV